MRRDLWLYWGHFSAAAVIGVLRTSQIQKHAFSASSASSLMVLFSLVPLIICSVQTIWIVDLPTKTI